MTMNNSNYVKINRVKNLYVEVFSHKNYTYLFMQRRNHNSDHEY